MVNRMCHVVQKPKLFSSCFILCNWYSSEVIRSFMKIKSKILLWQKNHYFTICIYKLQRLISAIFQIFQKGWNDDWPTLKTSWKHLLKSLGCPLVIYMCAQCFWRFRVRAKHSPFSLQAISFWTITVWPCLKAQQKYIWSS